MTNEPVILAFALGDDVSVDSILGIPTINELEMEMNFCPMKQVISHVLETAFACIPKETVRTTVPDYVPKALSIQQNVIITKAEEKPSEPDDNKSRDFLPAFRNAPLNYYMPAPPEPIQEDSSPKRVKLNNLDEKPSKK